MLIELCSFKSCISNSAVYQSGDFVMNKCCGYMCYSTSSSWNGQFLYTTSISSKNNILDSSISHSMKDANNPSYSAALYPYYGKILIHTVNLSNNVCRQNSALYCDPTSGGSASSPSCSVSHCSINSNIAKTDRIIYFYSTGYYYSLTYSNIIYNEESGSGLLYSE